MHKLPQETESRDAIKSLSLQDLVHARAPIVGRTVEVAKTALMIWGAISLSAAAGYTALHLQGGPAEPVLQSERQAIERSAAAAGSVSRPAAPAKLQTAAPAAVPQQVELARMPRPRPDEPVITGSLAPLPGDRYARNRYADPCEAWNSLGMPFRLRCIRESRAAPPYYPGYPDGW